MRCLIPLLTILLALPASPSSVLRIRSQSGVTVLWEGVALGETDAQGLMVIEDIPPGGYRLTLRKAGYYPLEVLITATEGASSAQELMLKPVSAATGSRAESSEATADRSAGRRAGLTEQVREPAATAVDKKRGLSPSAGASDGDSRPAPAAAESPAGIGSSTSSSPGSAPSSEDQLSEAPRATGVAPEAGQRSDRAGAAPGTPFSPFLGVMVLLLALLAGAAGARFFSRSRAVVTHPHPAPGSPAGDEEIPVFEEEADRGSPGFLEDLKRRERKLEDWPEPAPARPEETIIEVEAIEVRPADET